MYHLNLQGHSSIVVSLAIVENTMFSGSMDGTLKVWDLTTFKLAREASLGPVFALKISSTLMFSGHLNGVKVWDLQTFDCKGTLSGHVGNVKALCVVANRLFTGSSDCSIKVWNLENMTCLHTLTGAHSGEIREMLATQDSTGKMIHLWSCSDDATIRVWNQKFSCDAILKGHKSSVKALVRSGEFVFSGSDDTYIKIWHAFELGEVSMIPCLLGITSLAVSASTTPPSLVSGHTDGSIKIWNLKNIRAPECHLLLSGHTEPVRALLVANSIIFSGGYDKTIKVWYEQHQQLSYKIPV